MNVSGNGQRRPPKRGESRFAFARADEQRWDVFNAPQEPVSPRAVATHELNSQPVRKTGIVCRIVGDQPMPRYGFIQTKEGDNVFFHYKTLPVDLVACIERGTELQFEMVPNPFSNNRPMAINIRINDNENKFSDSVGVLTKWFPEKGFGFIDSSCGTIHFAHKTSFVMDDPLTSKFFSQQPCCSDLSCGEEVKVVFDKSINYKASPPKPFAINIRVASIVNKPLPKETSPLQQCNAQYSPFQGPSSCALGERSQRQVESMRWQSPASVSDLEGMLWQPAEFVGDKVAVAPPPGFRPQDSNSLFAIDSDPCRWSSAPTVSSHVAPAC